MSDKLTKADRELLSCIPSNWCDSLLTGNYRALHGQPGTWGCQDIERLLNAIRMRLTLAVAKQRVAAPRKKRKRVKP